MTLPGGTQIGAYEVLGLLGAGGMGEVYRARDARLRRDVALKVLPSEFAGDPDRLARFRREAHVLATLNHPHIAAIYGFEEVPGAHALVLELVEGATLAERIARGPLPIADALKLAAQIADALDAAHEKGIVHRDLKPANIKLTADDRVKVLDFGLAKALADEAQPDASQSPTMTAIASRLGVIVGTAAYMSPEQAKGRPVDKRTDIWAFGCVLYEMLTGRRAFEGEDVTEFIVSVMTKEPDWAALPPATPPRIVELLKRCLKKDARDRLRDIGDARLDLADAAAGTPRMPSLSPRTASTTWPALFAAASALAVLLAIPTFRHLREHPLPTPELRLELTTPPTTHPQSLAVSPDGRQIVFVATSERRPTLWVRALDSASARPLAGTDGASLPFWSADSRSIGFFADARLKRIDVDGGSLRVLANSTYGQNGTWNTEGAILFTPVPGRPILRVPAAGGVSPTPVTRIEASQESGHFDARFLPDGRHFLYTVFGRDIYVGQIDGPGTKRLVENGAKPMYVATGHLLFVRQGTLFAQRFNADRLTLTGNPFPVVDRVGTWDGNWAVDASQTGTIAYRSASGNYQFRFVWFDRSGREISKVGTSPDDAAIVTMPAISPDSTRLALFRQVSGTSNLWFLSLTRGVASRFTATADAADDFPVWSPDGTQVVFASTRRGGVHDLYQKRADGGEEKLLLQTTEDKMPSDWSPDARYVLYFTYGGRTQNDIWALPLDGDRKPFPVVQTEFEERNGQFSPDGKWIAYQSNESGRFEVYVQPFPGPGPKTRISTEGGAEPRWRHDGKEVFYMALDRRLTAVPIRLPASGGTAEAGGAVPLFLPHPPKAVEVIDGPQYVVSADGQRFLVNTIADETTVPPISLIVNWTPPAD